MTRAILLAAGQGSRLRPHTSDKPKCMVPYKGRPLIEYQIDTLRRNGISDIRIIGGYRHEKLKPLGLPIYVNPSYDSTNMVSTLFTARQLIEGDVLICYTDIVYQDLLIDSLLKSDKDLSVLYDLDWRHQWEARMSDPLADAETFRVTSENRILELGQPPESIDQIEGQYIGLIKLSSHGSDRFCKFYEQLDPEALYESRSFQQMYMTTLLQLMIDAGDPVFGVPVRGGWLEFDQPSDLTMDLVLPS